MALDKLVDSTKLDAALTYTADRIRLKTGGSADLDFDYEGGTGFGDDVDAIPTGGGGITPDQFYGKSGDAFSVEFNDLTEFRNRSPFYFNTKIKSELEIQLNNKAENLYNSKLLTLDDEVYNKVIALLVI